MPQTRTTLALALTVSLLAGVFSISCLAEDAEKTHHRNHTRYEHGIRNLHRVHPWLFRGGEPPEEAFKTLAEMGVTMVIDLRDRKRSAEKEKSLCKSVGLHYVQIPMSHRTQPTAKQISEFLKIVANAKEHTGKGSVFVHCELGDDRTGCMIAISRIAFDDYTFDEAYQEMLHFGFSRHFDALRLAVQQYAEQHAKR